MTGDRSTARTVREYVRWVAGYLGGGVLVFLPALAAIVLVEFSGIHFGAGLECETAAACERLAAEQKAILRTAIPYTVAATVALVVLVFGYNLYTGAGPGAVSDRQEEQ